MRRAINIVRGAVAKNEALPILTHIHVYNGRVQASNGRIVIDTPCPKFKDMNFTVSLKDFVLAIDACDNDPNIVVKESKLTITSGKFKANITMLPEAYPVVINDISVANKTNVKILELMKRLLPFVSDNANKAWSCGIFFDKNNAYATNSVVLVTSKCDDIGSVNISSECVEEIIRIGMEPTHILSEPNHISFFFEDETWIRATTLNTNWPNVEPFIPKSVEGIEITDEFRADLKRVALFSKDNRIHFSANGISDTTGEIVVQDYDLFDSWFNSQYIKSVCNIADRICLSTYPKPCGFIGENIKGMIIGIIP